MPYAAKAEIEHEYGDSQLKIWLTFKHPMRRSAIPQADPPVYDWLPPLDLWILKADSIDVEIISSVWIDEFTLQLTSDVVASQPAEVTLAYDGPSDHLQTSWHKQWEPWGPIVSVDLTTTLFQKGMILLWSGTIASIPSGWQLCDGTNGTPNLKNKFIVGAGDTYNPNATGGNTAHTHSVTFNFTGANQAGVVIPQNAPNGNYSPAVIGSGSGTTASANSLPPYYALAYIMKL